MKNPIAALLALILGVGVTLTALSLDDQNGATATVEDDIGSFQPSEEELQGLRQQFPDELFERLLPGDEVPRQLRDQLDRLFMQEFFFDDGGAGRFFFEIPPGDGRRFEFRPPGFGFPDLGLVEELLDMGLITEDEADQLRQAFDLLEDVLQRERDSST